MTINKGRIIKLAFASFLFAVLYSIGISIATNFVFIVFLKMTISLTVIFFIVMNVVDFVLNYFINLKRK
ncbi:MAG: hypothetical protein RR515_01015 [Clostridium sp.]